MSDPPVRAAWVRYTDAASIGIEIAASVAIGALAGLWLEHHVTHWAPWTSLLGLSVGLGAATKAIVRTARNFQRELARARAEEEARAIRDPQVEEPEP